MKNVAIVDGSHARNTGGWGVRLITHTGIQEWRGRLPGKREVASCEARAILEALRRAPAQESLVIYTDASGVAQSIHTGSSRCAETQQMINLIHQEAKKKSIPLRVEWRGREGKHQRSAHELAKLGRLALKDHSRETSRAKIETSWGGQEVWVELMRPALKSHRQDQPDQPASRIHLTIPLKEHQDQASAITALLELIPLLEPGEKVKLKTDSPLLDLWIQGGLCAMRDVKTRKTLAKAARHLRKNKIEIILEEKP